MFGERERWDLGVGLAFRLPARRHDVECYREHATRQLSGAFPLLIRARHHRARGRNWERYAREGRDDLRLHQHANHRECGE